MSIWELTDRLTFTIPLKVSHQRIAKELSQNKLTLERARDFYYNVLAICAVKDYLELFDYETDWDSSDFHDPVMSTFADVADLELKNHGKLECRAVFSDEEIYISPDAWSNRIGYVFVSIDESQREQHIIGFVPSVEETEGVVSLSQLRSLDDFPEYLSQKEQIEVVKQSIGESIKKRMVILREWFDKTQSTIEREWQNAEGLLMRQPQNLSYMTRNSSINKAKLIDLRMNLANQKVMLLMTVTPESEEKLKIRARLCPVTEEMYLPPNLELKILSELDEPLKEVKSESKDSFIQLPEFTGESGDKFKLRITLGDASVTENFTV
jgi:hypothetical protein